MAACIFNEGFLPAMNLIGVTIGQTGYAETVDNARILRTEKTAEAIYEYKEARTLRRALKAAENDNFEETERFLYAPGIAD
ncbi:hypothetical protein TNCT_67271 [Trichonephila clavata]|uniref:Uncharacterized protein n=1 Tax=Trichonephila clavata TaxID=2740835 RepID=A0A8X6IHG9_TRICU|nr:hypothetical protein TNCT_67271 [Trichonephila clavata]